MRNTRLVIKHEIITTLKKRSFWIMTFVFPGLIMLLSLGMQVVGERAVVEAEEAASSVEGVAGGGAVIGYVDAAGVITFMPDWIPPGIFYEYADESAAQAAMESGELRQYYLVPEDFLDTGEFLLVDSEFQPIRSAGNAEIFEGVLWANLIEKDPLGIVLVNPTPKINNHPLTPPAGPDKDNPLTRAVPIATLFIFFFVITTSSGFMLQSVAKEKENRTAEILLVSLRPRELMLGKVIGLGVVAVLQMTFWFSGSLFALKRSQQTLELAQGYTLPSGFVLWAVLFFILGYFLYASILGVIGVLAPNAREGGQFTFPAILPLLLPVWFNVAFIEAPHGPVATFLSLFPLSAPSAMITRLATGGVPGWQIVASLLGLLLTAYIFVMLAARLFPADTLLSSASLTWKRLFKAVR